MEIKYFFRNRSCGFSIHHVFQAVLDVASKQNRVSTTDMPSPNSMPWNVVSNSFFAYKNRNKDGIIHITGHIHDVILGLIGCKNIITIHDLVFLDNVKNPIKWFYKWLFWLYLPIKIADKVTCISETTKNNVLKYVKTDKLCVIYNAIDSAYIYKPKVFNAVQPVILHVGTGWNKNLRRTIEALEGLICHLRIIGEIDNEIKYLLEKHNISYSNVSNLSGREVVKEYQNCDIVNFPSEYEGFGMPIIEGQATGRVVLTSNIEPLIEVGGTAVHFVNPQDVTSLRAGYLKLIADHNYRDCLLEKGLENVKRFRKEVIAEQYIKVYNEVLGV